MVSTTEEEEMAVIQKITPQHKATQLHNPKCFLLGLLKPFTPSLLMNTHCNYAKISVDVAGLLLLGFLATLTLHKISFHQFI